MPVSIEQHVEWIADCIEHMREQGLRRIEATVAAEDSWVEQVNFASSVTLHRYANSWYLGANIPGKKRVFMPYVGGLDVYKAQCDQAASNGYEGFELRS